ncbi:ABC transporter permease [Cohnella nanjingensis]|uniref:ABC transporter permease n=1 Tax=Cohnella nanjingensis TaxID=1387779 RepID=A0A7X0VG27_9BACL|nr:ABC transporter permease [Cohnella nanjingensis]MBB6671888.1 ABC transporter permease [Cohnella nanjingensis]
MGVIIQCELMKLKHRGRIFGIIGASLVSAGLMVPIFLLLETGMNDWNSIFVICFIISAFITQIFLCVLSGEIFTQEYEQKTIQPMLMYPIDRSRLYYGKMAVMFMYGLLATVLSSLLPLISISVVNVFHVSVTEPFTLGHWLTFAFLLVVFSVTHTVGSIVYSYFSIVRRSTLLKVLACILLISPFGGGETGENVFFRLISVGIMTVLSLLFLIPTLKTFKSEDVG